MQLGRSRFAPCFSPPIRQPPGGRRHTSRGPPIQCSRTPFHPLLLLDRVPGATPLPHSLVRAPRHDRGARSKLFRPPCALLTQQHPHRSRSAALWLARGQHLG